MRSIANSKRSCQRDHLRPLWPHVRGLRGRGSGLLDAYINGAGRRGRGSCSRPWRWRPRRSGMRPPWARGVDRDRLQALGLSGRERAAADRLPGRLGGRAEHEVIAGAAGQFAVSFEQPREPQDDSHGPPAAFWSSAGPPRRSRPRSAGPDHAGAEVHVRPAQGAQLPAPEPCAGRGHPDGLLGLGSAATTSAASSRLATYLVPAVVGHVQGGRGVGRRAPALAR